MNDLRRIVGSSEIIATNKKQPDDIVGNNAVKKVINSVTNSCLSGLDIHSKDHRFATRPINNNDAAIHTGSVSGLYAEPFTS